MLIQRSNGFTIVEILIVIVVVGILAGIGTASYNGVQLRASNSMVQSDATKAANFLESVFLKSGSFPASGTDLTGSAGTDASTTLAYQSTGKAYCLEIGSTKAGTKKFTIRDDAGLTEGVCAGWVPSSGTVTPAAPAAPVASISSVTTNSFTVSWPAVAGATSYTVRYGTTASPATQAPSCSTSSCTITGLSANTTYYVTVSANNAGGSTTSAQRSTRTGGTYIGSAPGAMIICAYPSGGINVGWTKTSGAATLRVYMEDNYQIIEETLSPDPYYTNLFTYDFGQIGGGGTITADVSFIDINGNESATTTSSVTVGATDCYD